MHWSEYGAFFELSFFVPAVALAYRALVLSAVLSVKAFSGQPKPSKIKLEAF
jgi:hypothetical protein